MNNPRAAQETPTAGSPPVPRVGLWLYPDAPAQDLVDAVVAAEDAGADEMWIADEGVAREPLVLFAAAVAATRKILMGIGITTPLLRHPGAMGSSVATLDELAGGRAILGFGVGGAQSLDPFGLVAERPVALVRDAIRTARDVIECRKSDLYDPPAHAAPGRKVPIFVGAKGEQLNRMASREADGVFLSGFHLDGLETPVQWARSVNPIHVAIYASARFAGGAEDPTALCGSPATVAAGMHRLARRHQPETIGLALVDGGTIAGQMTNALEAVRIFRATAV